VPEDGLLVGKIVGVHGTRGNLEVHSYAESLSVFKSGSLIHVEMNDGRHGSHAIEWAKPHKRVILLSLRDVTTVERARAYIGAELFVDRGILPDLAAGTYYWSDIIGLSVFTRDQVYLGRVESIIPTKGNDVYVVKRDGEETLVPGLESVVLDIDIEAGTMRIDLPEGLS